MDGRSGCSGNEELTIYADTVPLSRPRKDSGCTGETRLFRASTDIEAPISYRWTLDNSFAPILSTKEYYVHTYDSLNHKLYVYVQGELCAIQGSVDLDGKSCVKCDVACLVQTAYIPAGRLVRLIDEKGKKYPIEPVSTVCVKDSNSIPAKAVRKAILAQSKCLPKLIGTAIHLNRLSSATCLTLTIGNCPIRFKSIVVDNTTINFDLSKC